MTGVARASGVPPPEGAPEARTTRGKNASRNGTNPMIRFCGRNPAAMPRTMAPIRMDRGVRRSSSAHATSTSASEGTSLNAVPP